jgi:Ni2+-binding GTPase involved in maturation of urease and hydrogenase
VHEPRPVILLTGALGSGKTTILRHLVTDPRLRGMAVLINELGEIGLDHHLIERVDGDVVLMRSGPERSGNWNGAGSAARSTSSRAR